MRRWVIGMLTVGVLAGSADVGVMAAQAGASDIARARVRDALAMSPLLNDTMTVVEDADYVAKVRDLLSALGVPDSSVRIRNAVDAARVLEHMLIPDTVNIYLESDPPGFTVRHYRIIDGPESWTPATTDTTLRLPAGLYRFGFLNSTTGEMRSQGRSCVEDCRLRWRN